MKGVVLTRYPLAQLIDLTHQVPAFQPSIAGFWLARCWQHFPVGTVHLAVVDPGVGTERGMLLVEQAGHVFVAPDNGLLDEAMRGLQSASWRSFDLTDLVHLQLPMPSRTFHGRDIFAPLVAEIAGGRQAPDTLGRSSSRTSVVAPRQAGQGRIVCADNYGNLITDIDAGCLELFNQPVILFRKQRIPIRPSYGFAPPGELLGLINSWGTLEIAKALGNAQQHLHASPGEVVGVVESTQAIG